MKQLSIKLSLLLFFMTYFAMVHGQGNMYVHLLNDEHPKFSVSSIDKLTFYGENMLVTFKSSAVNNYAIPTIRYCNFKEVPDWGGGRPIYTFRIFPNPTINKFSIIGTIEMNQIIVYNIPGQKLLEVFPDSKSIQLELNNYSRGVYLLKIMTPEGIFTEKVIKD